MKTFFTLLLTVTSLLSGAQTLQNRNVATGFDTPWEILWGPDNHIWMTERIGKVNRINPETGMVQTILTIPEVFEGNERGLMGMALHPNFPSNPSVYLAYTYGTSTTTVKVVRYQYAANQLTSPVIIIDNITGNSTHDGCRLFIDHNFLYITTGDAQQQDRPQNSSSTNGKVLRLNLDGSIPADNPVAGNPMYSKGHRNPQGMVVHNGIIYSSEHGANSDDEVNIITKAGNYGWPNVEGFCDDPGETSFCQQNNVIEPIRAWTPTLAVAGIDYYDNALIPEFANSLLMVSLKAGKLTQLKLSTNGLQVLSEKTIINNTYGRLRDICVSPDGRVFIATSNKDGRGTPGVNDDRIIELKPTGTGITAQTMETSIVFPNPVDSGKPFKVMFPQAGQYSVMVYDIQGKVVKKQDVVDAGFVSLDIPTLQKGIYMIKITHDGVSVVKKLVVQ